MRLAFLFILLLLKLQAGPNRPNILFIAIDDMNDWTGFLGGHPQAHTPNMDRLAAKGVSFTNAHCSAPACSPSRNALLFGVQPYHSGLYPFYPLDEIPDRVLAPYTSLPRFFKDNGYGVYGAGKIHHGSTAKTDEWTEYHKPTNKALTYNPNRGYQQGQSTKMAFCPTVDPLDEHPDFKTASYGVDILEREHEKPFFLAVGLVKPHLPFVCPTRFFDLYPSAIDPPKLLPNDLEDVPWAGRAMVKINDDFRYRTEEAWERVHRAYLACIAWADYNVGRLLDALDASQYAEDTLVVLWSDHGYHQGEKRSFRKFSLWEESTKVPFIIWDPRIKNGGNGQRCDRAVSLIHIYRTLAELTGLTAPSYVDGISLVPQMKNPTLPVDEPAITTWGRGNYSIRTDQWRYTRYYDGSEELYDHRTDPNEWYNRINDPSVTDQLAELRPWLPKKEAPLIKEGISLWNVVDADQPQKLSSIKKAFNKMNAKIRPPLLD